jgi:predicted transcriptional regulator
MPKAMTVRLTDEQAMDLAAMAQAEGIPVAEAVRQAVATQIEARRKDKVFQARLRRSLERNRKVLQRLAQR